MPTNLETLERKLKDNNRLSIEDINILFGAIKELEQKVNFLQTLIDSGPLESGDQSKVPTKGSVKTYVDVAVA